MEENVSGVAPTGDSFAQLLQEFIPDGSGAMSPDSNATMPMVPGTAGFPSAEGVEGAPSPEDQPLIDMDSLPQEQRDFLDRWYEENKFKADKAQLQSTYQQRINAAEAAARQAQEQAEQAAQFTRDYQAFTQTYWQEVAEGKRQPDPKDLAVWMVNRQANQAQTQVAQTAWIEPFRQHVAKDLAGHNAEVEKRSVVTTPDGQPIALFDKNDPGLLSLFKQYVELTEAHYKAGENSPYGLQASRAFSEYQRYMDKLESDGKFRVLAEHRNGTASRQQQVRQVQQQRGPVSLGQGGGAAPMDFKDFLAQAEAQLPQGNEQDHFALALALHRKAVSG
jgi:hypothetical protein